MTAEGRWLEQGEHYEDADVARLRTENLVLRDALRKIADMDYRGNKSTESVLAADVLTALHSVDFISGSRPTEESGS